MYIFGVVYPAFYNMQLTFLTNEPVFQWTSEPFPLKTFWFCCHLNAEWQPRNSRLWPFLVPVPIITAFPTAPNSIFAVRLEIQSIPAPLVLHQWSKEIHFILIINSNQVSFIFFAHPLCKEPRDSSIYSEITALTEMNPTVVALNSCKWKTRPVTAITESDFRIEYV